MTSPPKPPVLTPEQQGRILGILSVGCDRETAVGCIGCSLEQFALAFETDAEFATSVVEHEARVELTHMKNIMDVATNKKDWRVSVWWLEQRAPERFNRRTPNTVTTRQLKVFLDQLAKDLVEDIRSAEDRERAIARLHRNHQVLDILVDELLSAQAKLNPDVPLLGYLPEPTDAPLAADHSIDIAP